MKQLLKVTLITVGLLTLFQDDAPIKNTTHVDRTARQTTIRPKRELQNVRPAENQLESRESAAKQQAEAAVKLLLRAQPRSLWPLLRHSSDPSIRSYVIHGLAY